MSLRANPPKKDSGVRPWLALCAAAIGVSCFNGADAQGLPCVEDQDCGRGQSCVDGICGGSPATTSASDSSGSSGVDSGSGSGSGSASESSTGISAECGNGVVDAELGEECDPGSDSDTVTCDSDCTTVMCGDGHLNMAAGEQCDDNNLDAVDDCTADCLPSLFWDDMEQDPSMTMKWMPEIPSYDDGMGGMFELASGWVWGIPEPGTWHSGPYSEESGTARIITRPITFPPDPGPGLRYELHFRHRVRFDGNPMDQPMSVCSDPLHGDGGVVWIREDGMLRPAGPPPGHMQVLDNEGGCSAEPTNPLYDEMMPRPVYSGITPGMTATEVSFPLPDVAGKTVELVFEVSYDCGNCWEGNPEMGAGWTIDDVVVAPFPM